MYCLPFNNPLDYLNKLYRPGQVVRDNYQFRYNICIF